MTVDILAGPGFSECARTRGCNMFPHYMGVAGWLALAAVALAWIAMAVYLTGHVATRSTAPSKSRWIVALWLLPVVGVVAYLVVGVRTQKPQGSGSEPPGDGGPELREIT